MSICVEQVLLKNDSAVRAFSSCFAPFEKGGHGGFALRMLQQQEQKQIPLDPPFAKGEKKRALRERYARRTLGMCGWVDA